MHGVLIAGTHSGCGKTTVTLGMLAAFRKKGYRVQPFKAGPDFIDAGLHRLITGRHSINLDLWMCGREYVRECFAERSADADIAVVEGVMGMYDGNFSSADLAEALGLQVVLVVDAYGMAESAGAVVKGFVEYRKQEKGSGQCRRAVQRSPKLAGVIFNRVASDGHYKRLRDSVREVSVLGCLPRNPDFIIPHRHLGLTVAEETPLDSSGMDKLADVILENIDIEAVIQGAEIKDRVSGERAEKNEAFLTLNPRTLESSNPHLVKIAVARDRAFCFYYEDNLNMLRDKGAEIVDFSPLSDIKIPDDADAVYIGGGYPELYAEELSNNSLMLESVRDFSNKGMPVYAECGGFMYLTEGIYDFYGRYYPMAGVFPFKSKMKKTRSGLGYREAVLKEDTFLGGEDALLRGHEFHYSELIGAEACKLGRNEVTTVKLSNIRTSGLTKVYSVKDGEGNYIYDEGYRIKNSIGSYIHMHFGSDSRISHNFIDFIKEHHGNYSSCRTRQSDK